MSQRSSQHLPATNPLFLQYHGKLGVQMLAYFETADEVSNMCQKKKKKKKKKKSLCNVGYDVR